MRRLIWFFIFMICFLVAGNGFATTYYIAATGSDSNNGTSTSTPWVHAPGMPSCASTCASTTPAAGDSFIFRGGDTWHGSTGSPVGFPWTWTWPGYLGNPIYIGVDKTWFTGSSWARPILSFDNPPSTSLVSSCTFDDTARTMIYLNGANYVTLDNFEFTGLCWSSAAAFASATYVFHTGNNHTISNNYFHGWTSTTGCQSIQFCDAEHLVDAPPSVGATNSVVAGNVWDGSDSPPASGFAIYADCYDVHQNVFRYLSNGAVCSNTVTAHDNLFEHITTSFDGTSHGNVFEWISTPAEPIRFYNNVVRHTNLGVTLWPWFSGGTMYFFDNVMYDIGNGLNCIDISGTGSAQTLNFYNNTILSSCKLRFTTNVSTPCFQGTANFSNNHFIGYGSPGTFASTYQIDGACSGLVTINELTGDVFQSLATASSQGYTSNGTGYCVSDTTPCAPTGSTNATVGAGTNRTGSCSTFSSDSALCSGTTLGATETKGILTYPARTPIPRPSSGAWEAGAYQFGSTTATRPSPPVGLSAVAH